MNNWLMFYWVVCGCAVLGGDREITRFKKGSYLDRFFCMIIGGFVVPGIVVARLLRALE